MVFFFPSIGKAKKDTDKVISNRFLNFISLDVILSMPI